MKWMPEVYTPQGWLEYNAHIKHSKLEKVEEGR